jgi:hypothetical protein
VATTMYIREDRLHEIPFRPSTAERRLRWFNAVMAALHAGQAVVLLLLSTDFALPVTAGFLQGPPGTDPVFEELFEVPLGPAVAAFLALSAVFHALVASPWGFPRYVRELRRSRNRFRWVEYSLSASLMIVLIALVTGITDVAALIALFGVNAAMILFGWEMETRNDPGGRVVWSPFVMGCVAGIVPWLAIGLYLWGPTVDAEPPGFVYGIFVSLFVFFNVFALNQWLQYRQVGRWRDYLVGEAAYVVLSLTAKSALAWQVFANVLVG